MLSAAASSIFFSVLFVIAGSFAHAKEMVVAPDESPSDVSYGSCSADQYRKNIEILKTCSESWNRWGVDTPPPVEELLDPKQCSTALQFSKNIAGGCAEAVISVPAMLGELYIRGVVSAAGQDTDSYGYVSQNGSLLDIENYLTNQWVRSRCRFADHTEDNQYMATQCRQVEQIDCNGFLNEIRAATACRRSQETKNEYAKMKAELKQKANEIYREQQERKAFEAQHKTDLKALRDKCSKHLNKYSESYAKIFLNPLTYLATETASALRPNPEAVKNYNACILENSAGNKELQEKLLKTTAGIVDGVVGHVESLKCYREDIQLKLKCDLALSLTGVAGAGKVLVKKLGRNALLKKADQLPLPPKPQGPSFDLTPATRFQLAEEALGGKTLTDAQKVAILKAHEVGAGELGKDGTAAVIGNYTDDQLKRKLKLLEDAGFTPQEAKTLARREVVGALSAPVEHLVNTISSYPGLALNPPFTDVHRVKLKESIVAVARDRSSTPRRPGSNYARFEALHKAIVSKIAIKNPNTYVPTITYEPGGKVVFVYESMTGTKTVVKLNVIDNNHYFTVIEDRSTYLGLQGNKLVKCKDMSLCHMPVVGWRPN